MRFWICVIGFVCIPQCFAQNNNLLYQINKEGYQTSYIFGTVHIIPDSLYFFTKTMEKTLSKSELVVFEIDNVNDVKQAQELLTNSKGNSFSIFSPTEKDSVLKWGASKLNVTPEIFEKSFQFQKPFVLLQLGILDQMRGNTKKYEQEIEAKASRYKIPIAGLENMAFQIGLFDQLPDSVLAEMVLEGIRYPQKSDSINTLMYQLYVNQDVEKLVGLTTDQEQAAMEQLLFTRNRNWIPKMETFMRDKKCFFAVGAAHLGGDKGVLKLLINQGFTITPINL